MKLCRSLLLMGFLTFIGSVFAAEERVSDSTIPFELPNVGSWTFSGMVSNESGERYGYFFQMQKQGTNFHSKTALIDGQTNTLVFYYEGDEVIPGSNPLNWQVGRSFIKYNPITDSWLFGVDAPNKKGFNFKVDMLKLVNSDKDTLMLRPGVKLQTIQTSRLNGHIKVGTDSHEQFVTSNKAWFGRLWFSTNQSAAHEIKTTFCRLANEKSFYSAYLMEEDATSGFVAGFRDAIGNRVKTSQFISIKNLDHDQFLLSLALPKMQVKLSNTLAHNSNTSLIAGFSKDHYKDFCFVAEQSFEKTESQLVG